MRFLALVALVTLILPVSTGRQDGGDLVNAVLGNRMAPARYANETQRIRTHLLSVAAKLERVDARQMTPALRTARLRNLERLVEYARACRFPRNPATMPGRAPNFMDSEGAVCAVGYLVEQDLGRDAVVEITHDHQFDYVPYIDSPVLATWQATSGLTVTELAMIQPTYGGGGDVDDDDSGISNEDVLAISLMAADVVSSVVNLTYVSNGKGSRLWGGVGLFVGAFSIMHDRNRDDPTGYLTVGGIAAAALGAASVAITVGGGEEEHRVLLGPAWFAGHDRAPAVGLQACLRL
ncbi:MAG TPA: hypothetical protein VF247_12560 [Candidatus Krumholzibacteria bacterium]